MSAEVAKHLQALIEWEIDRSDHDLVDATEGFDYGRRPTQPLSLEKWEFVRDALADLWAWWGDGVHLRRPVGADDRGQVFEQTYSDELVMNSAPRDPDVQQTGIVTVRTVTLDGHLGYALFRLNVLLHFEVAKKRGWLERPEFSPRDRAADLWDGVAKMGEGPRRYQTSIKQGSKEWRVFAPYGDKPEYFEYYSNRINGGGWRRRFPSGIELKGVDLRDTVVDVGRDDITFDSCNLSAANLIA